MTDLGSTIANWRLATLADLFEIKDRDRIPVNADERATRQGTVPYYGATGQVGWIDDFIFDEELILLGEDGAPFLQGGKPKAYVIRGKTWVNNHAHVLRALGSSPSAFWKYQLDQVDYHGFVSGTTRLKLPQGSMRQIRLLVPPLSEQHRIVEAIESYFTRLDDAVATLERVQRNLKRYRASVLKAAVEGRLVATEAELARAEGRDYEPASVLLERVLAERRRRWEEAELAKLKANGMVPKDDKWKAKYKEPVPAETDDLPELPEGWCWATAESLSDETRSITYGVVKLGASMEGGVPTLRSSNVRHLRLDLDYIKPISDRISNAYRRTILKGDEVLVTVRGTLGGVVATPPSCIGFNISREVAMIAVVEPCLAPLIATFIASSTLQSWMMKRTRGIAYTGINIATLKKLPIPVPPLAEQGRIVEAVEHHLTIASETERECAASVRRSRSLRQSILKWAFEGRLVDQDLGEEPASALLERIKAEREAKPARFSRSQRPASRASKVGK